MAYSTLSETILEEIRRDIISGRLKPGTKIDQNRLKKRLGVSVIPLREAFKRLEAEGYVDIIPHHGVHVKPLSREEIEDLYLIRAEIEALAARLALVRLTDADIKELKTLFAQMKQLTEAGAYEETLRVNRRFHYTIYRACRRGYLLQMLDELWLRSSRYRNLATVKPSRAKKALVEHRAILQACIRRDVEALVSAVKQNIEETRKMFESVLQPVGPENRQPGEGKE